MKTRPPTPTLLSYLLSAPLVIGATSALYQAQRLAAPAPTDDQRPYGIGFVLLIAALTAFGGRGPGLVTLLLSLLATVYALTPPAFSWQVSHYRDFAEIVLLVIVGGVVIAAIDSVRRLRERTDVLLQESEEARARVTAIMDAAAVAVITCDAQGVLNYANPEAERLWGQPLQEIGPEGWANYGIHDADGNPVPPEELGLAKALRGDAEIVRRNEIQIRRPDGSRIWVKAQSTRIRRPGDPGGDPLGAVSAFVDITERKMVEEALRRSEEAYRVLAESLPQMVWTARPDGWFDYFNSRWFEYTGLTLEETQGWGWSNLLHPEDRRQAVALWKRSLETGEEYNVQYRFRRASDGSYRWFLGQAIPLRDDDGIIRWFGTCTDIHVQKEAETARERLLAQEQWRATRETLLNRIERALRLSFEPENIAALATRELGRAMNADRCYIASLDFPRGIVAITSEWRRSDLSSLRGEHLLSDFHFDLVSLFPEGKPLVVTDREKDTRFAAERELFTEAGLYSAINVPLYEDNVLTDILVVATADQPREWTEDEVSLVGAVAAQTRATMKVANLRLKEHNIAERLQDALKPALPEQVAGLDLDKHYAAALDEASVGGDFFDVFVVEKGIVALVVGDLAGKGLDAASQTATVRSMLRFALYRGDQLSDALTLLNEALTEHNLLTGFATLFVGLYDTESCRLTYASCGNEPSLVRRVTGQVEELETTSPVLGAFLSGAYEVRTVTLAPGDAVIAFTDGLTEAGRARGDFLGVKGVAALAAGYGAVESASALARRIIEGVQEHAQGLMHDDQCLLVAVVQGKEGPVAPPANL